MGNLFGNVFGNTTNKSADETMAVSSIAAAAASATAYLSATLEATTPEVRRLFSEYTTQSVIAHEAATTLAINKGWISPNDDPAQQLQTSFEQSQVVIQNMQ